MHPTLYPKLTLYSTYPRHAQLPYTATPHPKKRKGPSLQTWLPCGGCPRKRNLYPQYKHTDTAPLNNFFDFTYPEAAPGPPPGQWFTSHIPSDGIREARTPDRVRGPLLIFRKILNYGKTKKSTHCHQNAKPYRTEHLPCTTYPRPQRSRLAAAPL